VSEKDYLAANLPAMLGAKRTRYRNPIPLLTLADLARDK
jgi:hypothetical protein